MRGKKITKKNINPDVKYGNVNIAKLINKVTIGGKKSISRTIVYGALEEASNTLKIDPVDLFNKVIENTTPSVEVRSRRVGGANFQVPIPVSPERQITLALRWIISASRSRKGMPMKERLSKEFIEAYNNSGGAVKKKTDIEKMAEANKAFSYLA